jgi:hypothetical protein
MAVVNSKKWQRSSQISRHDINRVVFGVSRNCDSSSYFHFVINI